MLPKPARAWLLLVALLAAVNVMRFVRLDADFPPGVTTSRTLYTDEGWYSGNGARIGTGQSWYIPGEMNVIIDLPSRARASGRGVPDLWPQPRRRAGTRRGDVAGPHRGRRRVDGDERVHDVRRIGGDRTEPRFPSLQLFTAGDLRRDHDDHHDAGIRGGVQRPCTACGDRGGRRGRADRCRGAHEDHRAVRASGAGLFLQHAGERSPAKVETGRSHVGGLRTSCVLGYNALARVAYPVEYASFSQMVAGRLSGEPAWPGEEPRGGRIRHGSLRTRRWR